MNLFVGGEKLQYNLVLTCCTNKDYYWKSIFSYLPIHNSEDVSSSNPCEYTMRYNLVAPNIQVLSENWWEAARVDTPIMQVLKIVVVATAVLKISDYSLL